MMEAYTSVKTQQYLSTPSRQLTGSGPLKTRKLRSAYMKFKALNFGRFIKMRVNTKLCFIRKSIHLKSIYVMISHRGYFCFMVMISFNRSIISVPGNVFLFPLNRIFPEDSLLWGSRSPKFFLHYFYF